MLFKCHNFISISALAVIIKKMWVSRQVRRENKKPVNKHERKLDWTKVKKTLKTLLFVCLFFTLIVFSITHYTVKSQNAIRNAVSRNPVTKTAKVTSISSGKGPHAATYHFDHNGKTFTGKSFHSYAGEVGQTICIEYLLSNADINLLCDEKEYENLFDDSFLFSAKIFGLMILFIVLYILWKIISKDKKVIAELTSRKNNYR